MNEISTEMVEVEKSVNKSSNYVHRLNEVLLKQQSKKTQKNFTEPKVFFPS